MEIFNEPSINRNILNSSVLILVFLLSRFFIVRAIMKSKLQLEVKRKSVVQAKNTSIVILVVGLLLVWGPELRTFAISLVAIAAAIVIATKELILCFMGGLLKAMARPFKIGDRIELLGSNVIRGNVIDHDFTTTTLLEIGPGKLGQQYTGKMLTIPNSLFLSVVVVNESKANKYGLHTFTVIRSPKEDILQQKKMLLEAANEVCGDYLEDAKIYLNKLGEVEGLEAPGAEPRVSVFLTNHDKAELVVRVPVEELRTGRTEQAIVEKYLAKSYAGSNQEI